MTDFETMMKAEDAQSELDKIHFIAAEIINRSSSTAIDKNAIEDFFLSRDDINTLACMLLDYETIIRKYMQEIIDGHRTKAKPEG